MLNYRWVAPYNPYLLTRYNCHINVEVCSGFIAVMYLYKCIYEGHDRVTMYVADENKNKYFDEIKQFQDARWVSAQEAMWRIFEFNLNEIFPAVTNLQLHLPGQQNVTFWERQNLKNVVDSEKAKKTTLTEFFETCSRDEKAKGLLYKEFPEHYVWESQPKRWKTRQQRGMIGRVNSANPKEGER